VRQGLNPPRPQATVAPEGLILLLAAGHGKHRIPSGSPVDGCDRQYALWTEMSWQDFDEVY